MSRSLTTACALLMLGVVPALADIDAKTPAPQATQQDGAATQPVEKEVPPMDGDSDDPASNAKPVDDCCDTGNTPPEKK